MKTVVVIIENCVAVKWKIYFNHLFGVCLSLQNTDAIATNNTKWIDYFEIHGSASLKFICICEKF